ncbi:MAG: PAS domain S-box protein [Pirellulales bacterium]|nr:PAS domain S-box protein [Pirellulales bacterium]
MRIGLKLTAAFLLIASLVGAVGYLAHGTTKQVEQQMERLSRSALLKVADSTEIIVALYAKQLAAHAYLHAARESRNKDSQTPPPSERHGLLESHQASIEASLARQNQVAESMIRWAEDRGLDDMAERERTQTLETLRLLRREFDKHLQIQDEFLAMVEQNPDRAEVFLENRLCEHFETQLLPILAEYRKQAENELTQSVRATERAIVVADQRRGMLIVLAAVGAILMGLFTSQSIGKPLAVLQHAAEEIGHGRFDVQVPVGSRDEIGMLAGSIRQMASDLQETTVSKSYLDNIIQSMREMLIVVDPKLRISHVNQAACAELEYSQDDLNGKPFEELFTPEEIPGDKSLPEFLSPGIECFMQTGTGRRFPVHCSAAEMTDDQGKLEGYVCVASNISRQKEAEDRLVASLREKELLLKEVHHRVKNNLQVISSLLNLQAREIRDSDTAKLFRESQGRIRSMALIHEQLYRSDDLAGIDFAAYVQELVRHLERGLGSETTPIRFRLNIEPLPLSLDLAIPCGMIVNELVSNARKHAFPNREAGEISVEFTRREAGYCLTVADNGVGIQEELATEDSLSLGLKVVQALTQQIHGDLDVRHDEGTVFVIRFNPEKERIN